MLINITTLNFRIVRNFLPKNKTIHYWEKKVNFRHTTNFFYSEILFESESHHGETHECDFSSLYAFFPLLYCIFSFPFSMKPLEDASFAKVHNVISQITSAALFTRNT